MLTHLGRMRLYSWLGFRSALGSDQHRRGLAAIFVASLTLSLLILLAVGAESVLKVESGIRAWRSPWSETPSESTGLWLQSQELPTGSGQELTLLTIAAEHPETYLGWPEFDVVPTSGTVLVSEAATDLEDPSKEIVAGLLSAESVAAAEQPRVPDEMLLTPDELVVVRFASLSELDNAVRSKPIEPIVRRESSSAPSVAAIVTIAVVAGAATLLWSMASRYLRGRSRALAIFRLLQLDDAAVRTIAIVPIVATALIGAAGGVVGFGVLRSILSSRADVLLGFYAGRATVNAVWIFVDLAIVTSVAAFTALLAARKIGLSPLATERRVPTKRSRPVLGLSIVVIAATLLLLREYRLDSQPELRIASWWAAAVLVLVGLLLVTRSALTALAARQWTRPETVLGFGIVRGSSGEARGLFEPTLAILYACVLLVPLTSGFQGIDELADTARADLMFAEPDGSVPRLASARDVIDRRDTVDEVGIVGTNSVRIAGAGDLPGSGPSRQVWIGGCRDLMVLLEDSTIECSPDVMYLPPDVSPVETAGKVAIGFEGVEVETWQHHDGTGTGAIYWVVEEWSTRYPELAVIPWLVLSGDDASVADAIVDVSMSVPGLRTVIPAEYRESRSRATALLTRLVLAGILATASLAVVTYLAGTNSYLTERWRFMEHLVRLGLGQDQLRIATGIVVAGPLLLGSMLIVPAALITGRLLVEDSLSLFTFLWLGAGVLSSVLAIYALAALRVRSLKLTAPGRWDSRAGL